MPDYQLIGPYGADHPRALAGEGRRVGDKPDPAEVILTTFPSHSWDAAMQVYLSCKQVGIAQILGRKHGRRKVGQWWQFGGISNHLIDAAARLGVSTGAIHAAEGDATLKGISTRIGEIYGRYLKVKGPTRDNRDFTNQEIKVVEGLLAESDKGIARLHTMARAAMDAAEECREVHGMEPGEYRYRVVGPNEEASGPLQVELDAAKVEIKRLMGEAADMLVARDDLIRSLNSERDRAESAEKERAELLEQNKTLAAMVEQMTTPAPPPAVDGPTEPVAPPKPSPASPSQPQPKPQHKGR